MINLLIAYDDNDSSLAEYFESSYQYVSDIINPIPEIISHPICGLDCTEININDTVNGLNGQKFCFVGFSHGNSEMLLTDNGYYVSENNCGIFSDSLFYSTGCQTGLSLGKKLIGKGCSTFIGYFGDALVTFDQFHDIYISCENLALKLILTSGATARAAFDLMIENYDVEIEKMYQSNDIVMAMELLHNRDCMDILGYEELTQDDLHFLV
jgi:hypothetical protein